MGGMRVVMADIDGPNLSTAVRQVQELATFPNDVKGIHADVASVDDCHKLKEAVKSTFDKAPSLLMNNAGVGSGGGALAARDQWSRTLGVNMWGVINGCQTFVPWMMESGQEGVIVNTGSKQGITCPPGNLAYNVS